MSCYTLLSSPSPFCSEALSTKDAVAECKSGRQRRCGLKKKHLCVCVLWRKTSRPQFRLMSANDCDVICLTLLRHGKEAHGHVLKWCAGEQEQIFSVRCQFAYTFSEITVCCHAKHALRLKEHNCCSMSALSTLPPDTFASYALPRRQLSLLSVLKTPHSGNFTCCKK